MDGLIDVLLDWIGEHSRYDVAQIGRPAVVMLSAEDLTREMYTGVPHLIPDDGVDERINALYAHAEQTIYIRHPDTVDGAQSFAAPSDNPLWQEILLHELVHHVQWQSGEADSWMCDAQGERQAYHLGGVYLAQTGTPDPLANRAFWAQMYAQC